MAIPQANINMSQIRSGSFGATAGVRLEITNYNEIYRTLLKLDKTYLAQLKRNYREIGQDVQTAIRKAIPSKAKPPLRNMKQVHFGRLAWGTTYGGSGDRPRPAKSVLIQLPNTRSRKAKKAGEISILRLQVGSPATVLFDMAGRANYSKARRGLTPVYDYMYTIGGQKVPGTRQHRVVPGAFAKGLSKASGRKQAWASRIVWPAALTALPKARAKMAIAIGQANDKVNALLRSM